jgi:hypothetical protein
VTPGGRDWKEWAVDFVPVAKPSNGTQAPMDDDIPF